MERITWSQIVFRMIGMVDELINTRTILSVVAMVGFFYVAIRVLDALVDPPASELFAILNLTVSLPLATLAYYFGVRQREKKDSGKE